MLYNLYKILFENKDEFYFRNEWFPTDIDWEAMIMNLNNHAGIKNIFKKITVFNVDKMIRYYLVAKVIGYPCLDQYKNMIFYNLKNSGIFYDEFEIIDNKYIELPEVWKNLILDLEQYDKLGGVALRHENMGELYDDSVLFNAINNIKSHIESIHFSKLPFSDIINEKIITIKFRNGSTAYIRVGRWGANDHFLKTYNSRYDNLKRDRFASLLQTEMIPYINGEKTDNLWVKETL